LPAVTVQRVIDLALGPAAARSEHWTGRRSAKAVGVSLRSVQRILELMRPRIVRSPVDIYFGNRPSHAAKSRLLGQRHYQWPPFIALAMIGPTPGTVINCRSMVELYERPWRAVSEGATSTSSLNGL